MKLKENEVEEIILKLKEAHSEAKCSLNFTTPFELAIAVMLSAQCTDERVNIVTKDLFSKYNSPKAFANMDLPFLESQIHSCGFYKNKAKNIINLSKILIEKYNGNLPNDMEALCALPGIGRKSANVIMLEAFNTPCGIAVDTHAKRVSNRIGLSKQKEPQKIEQDLLKIIPKKHIKDVNHLFVYHGRKICDSRKPKCDICPINEYCEKNNI